MKGFPMMGTSSKHGTNKNFMKSGLSNADGSQVEPGAPFLGGLFGGGGGASKRPLWKRFLDPAGIFKKRGGNPNAQVDPNAPPVETPTEPLAGAPPVAPAAGAVDPNAQVDPNALGTN